MDVALRVDILRNRLRELSNNPAAEAAKPLNPPKPDTEGSEAPCSSKRERQRHLRRLRDAHKKKTLAWLETEEIRLNQEIAKLFA